MPAIRHTPGIRISFTQVMQGARHNILKFNQSVAFTFGVQFLDTGLWNEPGFFFIHHTILNEVGPVNQYVSSGWIGTQLPGRNSPNIWLSLFYSRAGDATGGRQAIFEYRPQIYLLLNRGFGTAAGTIPDEWAVAEEQHFFSIEAS